jgi:hypothetical protein
MLNHIGVIAAMLLIVCAGFTPQLHQVRTRISVLSLVPASAPAAGPGKQKKSGFDSDFAEMVSKPLPNWYIESKAERERLLKDVVKNRERIIQEFRAKYEVTQEDREKERIMRNAGIDARVKKGKKKAASANLFSSFLSKGAEVSEDVEEDSDLTTKEKWERFVEEEDEATGFSLPGFFEVFPELQLRWPTWGRRKDGSTLKCKTDKDCPVPLACCAHPIVPGDKFCCTGLGQRIMYPAYAYQELTRPSDRPESSGGSKGEERENWRPAPGAPFP